jgi:N-acetylneuraminic acid mutarotase
MKSGAILLSLAWALSTQAAATDSPGRRELTFEQRVEAQRAIERVFWKHRTWPGAAARKPALSDVVPDSVLRSRVTRYLQQSEAVEKIWNRPITGSQLQAELDRLASTTRDPAVLRELFSSLGNDAHVIAETLARQILADRLVRGWFAFDATIHEGSRERIELARSQCTMPSCLRDLGGTYGEREWPRRSHRQDGESSGDLAADETGLARIVARAQRDADGRFHVVESEGEFAFSVVLASDDEKVSIATVVWTKRSFEGWWAETQKELTGSVTEPVTDYVLPPILSLTCTSDTWSATPGPAEASQNSTAVWTGSEMIVWGGSAPGSPGTGGRYTPATDTWSPISKVNAPEARQNHTAVWTGSEMIVWGGSGNVVLRSGSRYNPTTDTWTSTTLTAAPAARYMHSAAWTGSEMLVWGGATAPDSFLNTGSLFDPATNSWRSMAVTGAPQGRTRNSAIWTGSEFVVWGGRTTVNGTGLNLATGGRYNPSTNTWVATPTTSGVPTARLGHSAIWTGSEMIVWGGYDDLGLVSDGSRYSPATDAWTSLSSNLAPEPRSGHTAIWTGSEMIVWGGDGGESSDGLATGGRYAPSTDSWSPTTNSKAPSRRYGHVAVWSGTEMIIWGGRDSTGGRYRPQTNSWVPTGSEGAPSPRTLHTAVWTGAEMIVWGGSDAVSEAISTGGVYVPATNAWRPTPTSTFGAPGGRRYHSALWTGRAMLVWGGEGLITTNAEAPLSIGHLNTGAAYDPTNDAWTPMATSPTVPAPRRFHTSIWTGKEMVVWGGEGTTGRLNTGGRYDPVTNSWTPTATGAPAPSARESHSAVWTGSQMIIWGGFVSTVSNSGARYTPATDSWTSVTTTGAPSARAAHSAVWTGTHMIVWAGIGADTGSAYSPATDSWAATSLIGSPVAPRSGHATIWSGREMVVWGGDGGPWGAGDFHSGGRYTPATDSWTPMSVVDAPVHRSVSSAVWDGRRLIVWGGSTGGFTNSGGLYCACPAGELAFRDSDDDGYGDTAISVPTCDGSPPFGHVLNAEDCDDSSASVNPDGTESCNGIDDNCDGRTDEDPFGLDGDGDGVPNACDNCGTGFNPAQTDFDHDGQGDSCDVDDGVIYLVGSAAGSIEWQEEEGPDSWNVYEGDLQVLRATGLYTQEPGSNELADRVCGLLQPYIDDMEPVPAGAVKYCLVTGVLLGVEGSLGTDSTGLLRPNTNPCP